MVPDSFGNRNFMQPMGRHNMHSKCLDYFSFKFGVGRDNFFHFSLQVLNGFPRFPMCSPRVFLIAPRFNHICFAQSPPLLTYIAGMKGEALHLSIESSILGESPRFQLVIGPSQKNVGLVRHPQLINIKPNK